ncbi:MAG: hypothetical protein QOD81_1109, partial [Solirubrobacteraceae bacterium]|nr:hypothetical protein [Solirubrobacteraceae bacterium]
GFGDLEWKTIATSTLLALVSAMAGAGLAVRRRQATLGLATVALSIVAFALVVAGLWADLDAELYWRVAGSCAIAALEGAHASSVLSRRRDGDVASVVTATRVVVAAAGVSGAMGIAPLAGLLPADDTYEEPYARLLGVVLVVQLAGTAVAPLLRRLAATRERPVGALPTPHERLAGEIDAVADRLEALGAAPELAAESARLRGLARAARALP